MLGKGEESIYGHCDKIRGASMGSGVAARMAWLFALVCSGFFPTLAHSEEPVHVTVCQLLSDPGHYNHALVEVTGVVGHGFEDFTLRSADCANTDHGSGVWIEYGGREASGTMYCCGVTRSRNRPDVLTIEGVTTQLKDDQAFRNFDEIIQKEPYAKARVTLVGRFFSGEPKKFPRGTFWVGYGHMGLFSLLVIEQVLSATALHVEN